MSGNGSSSLLDSIGQWVVEWCAHGSQRGLFHIDLLKNTLANNLDRFHGRHPGSDDWIPLGIFDKHEDAAEFYNQVQKLQDKEYAGGMENDLRIIKTHRSQSQIEELKSMPYREYLKTVYWQNVRRKMYEYALHKCQICYSPGPLNAHHRTYERRGEELITDVTVLCQDCHGLFHKHLRLKSK